MISMIREDAVWITWERQTRNRSASEYFNVPLYEIIEDNSNRALRYCKSTLRTLSIIGKKKPRYFFAQNPSIVLAILAISLKPLAKFKVIIDAHNAGIHGPENSGRILPTINQFIIRKADAVIVTNSELADHVNSCGGNPIVLPDPLPSLEMSKDTAVLDPQRKLKALCITSWSDDEPYREILEAASAFPDDIEFFFSGNYKKIGHLLPDAIPENVNLLGFVDERSFHDHLFSADFCIDMTKRSDCMVCGAYESISAEKPIILSDTPVQRRYFSKGALFSQNSALHITNTLQEMKDRIDTMRQDATDLKREILERETSQKALILSQIQRL
ncbi:glycosyltransferase family protein [Marinobacter sp. F4206]|uniref:hypothetical protein n=1 Tax=Marinobacter sp. F4206 TaxID=2861777 RepID=UPI001C605680|nr:hypothetical protein [Marinobacter sp. F4206]MBW4933407.1 hypothetical protein [Marinobacter sp. F4206]